MLYPQVTISFLKNPCVSLASDCLLKNGACLIEGVSNIFDEQPPLCHYKLLRQIQVDYIGKKILIDKKLNLLFNLNPWVAQRLACLLGHSIVLYQSKSFHLLQCSWPMWKQGSFAYIGLHGSLQYDVGSRFEVGYEYGVVWFLDGIYNNFDYHHPILCVLVRYTGAAGYEYRCTRVEAPLAELKFWSYVPGVLQKFFEISQSGCLGHPEIMPCNLKFPILVKIAPGILVSVSLWVLREEILILIHERRWLKYHQAL